MMDPSNRVDPAELDIRKHDCRDGEHVMLSADTCVCGHWKEDLAQIEEDRLLKRLEQLQQKHEVSKTTIRSRPLLIPRR